jgi:membrane-associated phospholipid phosphatase
VSTTEFPQAGAVEAADFRFAYWTQARRCALGLYFASLILWSAHYGVPVQRELVIAWICGALACTLLGRPPRQALHLVRDWLPIVAVLCAYDYTRGAADSLGIGVHARPMIDFDRFVFFGQTPTEWLQARIYTPGVNWLDVVFTLVYTSYFIVPFALAGVLWLRDRPAFLRFAKRLVSLALAGLATYIAFPAAPPWMASEMGLIGEVHRTTPDGWQLLGTGTAGLFSEGQSSANMVAAVPSLHSAFTALVAMFLWARGRRPRLRPLLVLYPLAMGLTLIATGEHYFFDVLLGWLYAGAAMLAWSRWERRRPASGRGDTGLEPDLGQRR